MDFLIEVGKFQAKRELPGEVMQGWKANRTEKTNREGVLGIWMGN